MIISLGYPHYTLKMLNIDIYGIPYEYLFTYCVN